MFLDQPPVPSRISSSVGSDEVTQGIFLTDLESPRDGIKIALWTTCPQMENISPYIQIECLVSLYA